MDPIWLKSYPPGIPAQADVETHNSLAELFERSVESFGDRTAYVSMGRSMSFAELERLSRWFGAYLKEGLRLPEGARVALMMPNLLQYPIALFGTLRAGYTVVNCNPLYQPRELAHQLNDSGAEAIVIIENSAHVLAEIIGATDIRHVVTTQVGDMLGLPRRPAVNLYLKYWKRAVPPWRLPGAVPFHEALASGRNLPWSPARPGRDSLAFLQYTGGTTGVPKGAMLTHGNITANLAEAHAWLRPVLTTGCEMVVTALPLYHIFALTANCLVFFMIGATNVLIPDGRDIGALVAVLARHRITVLIGVNTLFNALLDHPSFARLDFSGLRLCFAGGMPVHRTVADRWRGVTGLPLVEAYGLTEASPAVCSNRLDLAEYSGSIGLPIPSTEVAIRNDAGEDLPVGVAGELCVRGPQVMKGYWRRPDETAKVMTPDGFLRTGDIARIDEQGFLHMVDRKKDLIVVSGFKIWPNEIEDVVAMHPGVLDVGAVGVPDDRSGEAVKIVVVPRSNALCSEELLAHCRKYLTGYKVPRFVEFRTELPHSNIGKVLRRALR